jgi:hypothetical protein
MIVMTLVLLFLSNILHMFWDFFYTAGKTQYTYIVGKKKNEKGTCMYWVPVKWETKQKRNISKRNETKHDETKQNM